MSELQLTSSAIPCCEDTASAGALPVGGFFTPLVAGLASSASLAREPPPPCSSCGALATSHSVWAARGWGCAVCARLNDYASGGHVRYARAVDRQALPELLSDAHEVLLPFPGVEEEEEELGEGKGAEFLPARDGPPGTINVAALTFLVLDAAGDAGQLEDVRDSAITLLESMPIGARVVLVVFSEQVQCVVRGHEPGSNKSTADVGASSAPTPYPASLDSPSFQPQLVSLLREAQGLSLELALLTPAQAAIALSQDRFLAAATQAEPRPRALGLALQALLGLVARSGREIAEARCESDRDRRRLRASGLPPCIGARLALFLTGAPNSGLGACDLGQEASDALEEGTPAKQQRQALTSEDAFVLDASFPEVSAWAAAGAVPPSALEKVQQEWEGDSHLPWCAADESYCQEDSEEGGAGSEAPSGDVPRLPRPNPHAPALYASAGTTAASLGIVVDVFALQAASRTPLCLPLWAGLAENSGGHVFFYPGGCASTLAQDLCRRQQQTVAARCMLRIRAPEELQILVHASGRCWADASHLELHHIPALDATSTICFELLNTPGRQLEPGRGVVIQCSVQYHVLLPGPSGRLRLERRRRTSSCLALPAARPQTVWDSTAASPLAALLARQSLRAFGSPAPQGCAQAVQRALADWLAGLCARVALAEWQAEAQAGPSPFAQPEERQGPERRLDASLSEHPTLHHVPRLVYALARSPALFGCRGAPGAARPCLDARVAIRAAWADGPPQAASQDLYPTLAAWKDEQSLHDPRVSLSRAAVKLAPARIFLLDAPDLTLVQYLDEASSSSASSSVPTSTPSSFPPSASSALRRAASRVQRRRVPLPPLEIRRASGLDSPRAAGLRERLLEDAQWGAPPLPLSTTPGEGGGGGMEEGLAPRADGFDAAAPLGVKVQTLVAFLDSVQVSAKTLLKGAWR